MDFIAKIIENSKYCAWLLLKTLVGYDIVINFDRNPLSKYLKSWKNTILAKQFDKVEKYTLPKQHITQND